MSDRAYSLERMRVASPCPVDWSNMTGDDRVRFCNECSLNVYNISAMTRAEAETFIANTEGRICAKLYRRADGTIITRDCPKGLKTKRRRTSKAATAAFAALMSVCAGSAGAQDSSKTSKSYAGGSRQKGAAVQTQKDNRQGIFGKIVEPGGTALAGITVQVFNQSTKQKEFAVANDEGEFHFPSLEAGTYTLIVEAVGFNSFTRTDIEVGAGKKPASLDITMTLKGATVIVGIFVKDDDISISQGTTTIRLPD